MALQPQQINTPARNLPTAQGSLAGNLFNVGAGYLLGREGEQAFGELGQQALQGGERLGQQALAASAFKPYTVTSSLANVQTTPEGGFGINLSPEQQALQTQLQGQTAGLFGQVSQDPAQAQSALYEQYRAVQRPEEERQRLALQENLFSSGRGGVQTAQYGGTPEQFAYEQARQEAMARANVGARQQSQAEQLQAAQVGGLLQQAGYQPQQQALSLLEGSQIPAGYLSQGQRTGATLQGQLEQSGLEGYLQAAELGQAERLAQLQNMANIAGGSGTGADARQGFLDQIINQFTGGTGGVELGTQADIQSLIDYANNPIETSFLGSLPETSSSSFLGGNGFLSSIALPQVTNPYDTGSLFDDYVPNFGRASSPQQFAPQQNIDASGFNQSAFNDALGL
tara:strand:- start:2030 stop:3223 length:1194 start_codon:yes stop_codon:yes gene_type:complete